MTRPRVRLPRIASAAAVALAATLAPWGASAGASTELVATGWWTAAPVAVAPDAGDGDLVVQGGPRPDAPFAYAALEYRLAPGDSPATLTLTVAEGSASTPTAELVACPLTEPLEPASGGPAAQAPAHDCGTSVTAAPAADASYTFPVAELATEDRLAVAILPALPADRVVLAAPTGTALRMHVGNPSLPAPEEGDGSATPPPVAAPGTGPPTSAPPIVGPPAPAGTASFAPVGREVAAPPHAPSGEDAGAAAAPDVPAGDQRSAATLPVAVAGAEGADPRAVALFVLLLAAAGALWFGAGRGDPGEDGAPPGRQVAPG